ncbi:unnamed protein product [Schistosoma margrebowiei]|uniref:Uncharacterized protein n=1 Tax=Schistosoma margrebowiei TaxID=48269 RepID=A0A3P8FQ91_9TREM|nr:unnamed protein product [Schistosoma margrebowiei]
MNNQLNGTRHNTSTSLTMKRLTVWIEHYGNFFDTIVNLKKSSTSYDRLLCKVVHGVQLTNTCQAKTSVRQDCLLSRLLFVLVADWITKNSTPQGEARNTMGRLDATG